MMKCAVAAVIFRKMTSSCIFGLEKRTVVDLIQVRWPSGAVDTLTKVPANKIVTVKEGKGLVD